jgi:hypothetical protein
MYKFLQANSPFVRYGATLATAGRVCANAVLLEEEGDYAPLAITSNLVGLSFSHTKPGVVAESAAAIAALTALGIKAFAEGNGKKMWTAGVGILAFSNVFLNNMRYTKLCPERYRCYEHPLPQGPYTQDVKTQFAPTLFDKTLQAISPAIAVKWGARRLQESVNDKTRSIGDDLFEITQRKLFSGGMLAIAGITPFIIDGIQVGMATGNWKRAIAGTIIFAANAAMSLSIPQKQKHPLLAMFTANDKNKGNNSTITRDVAP